MALNQQHLVLEDAPRQKKSQDNGRSSFSKRPNGDTEVVLKVPRTNSMNSERRSRKASDLNGRSVPVIDEEKELEISVRNGPKYASNNSLSGVSNTGSRSGKKYSRQNGGGIDNAGYTGSTPSIASSGSPVIHEQYCYCTRWTKLEKTLGLAVSVLAFMVLVLIIAVGILAERRNEKMQRGLGSGT